MFTVYHIVWCRSSTNYHQNNVNMQYKTQLLVITFFLFQLISIDAEAKFVSGKVFLNNGKEFKCVINLPIRTGTKKITIKDDYDSKVRTLSSDDIDMIYLRSNGNNLLLKRTFVISYKIGGAKTSKTKSWIEVLNTCENITSYSAVIGYDVTRKGNFFSETQLGMATHYLKRPDESYPTAVGTFMIGGNVVAIGINKQRKLFLTDYFSNDKKALSFLNSKKMVTASEIFEYIDSICVYESTE